MTLDHLGDLGIHVAVVHASAPSLLSLSLRTTSAKRGREWTGPLQAALTARSVARDGVAFVLSVLARRS